MYKVLLVYHEKIDNKQLSSTHVQSWCELYISCTNICHTDITGMVKNDIQWSIIVIHFNVGSSSF